MTNTLRFQYGLMRVNSSNQAVQIFPQTVESTSHASDIFLQTIQLVGTAEELLSIGDTSDDVSLYLVNRHDTAIVEVGVKPASTFYPLIEIPPGKLAKLPRLSGVASTWLKSDVASTPVEIYVGKL